MPLNPTSVLAKLDNVVVVPGTTLHGVKNRTTQWFHKTQKLPYWAERILDEQSKQSRTNAAMPAPTATAASAPAASARAPADTTAKFNLIKRWYAKTRIKLPTTDMNTLLAYFFGNGGKRRIHGILARTPKVRIRFPTTRSSSTVTLTGPYHDVLSAVSALIASMSAAAQAVLNRHMVPPTSAKQSDPVSAAATQAVLNRQVVRPTSAKQSAPISTSAAAGGGASIRFEKLELEMMMNSIEAERAKLKAEIESLDSQKQQLQQQTALFKESTTVFEKSLAEFEKEKSELVQEMRQFDEEKRDLSREKRQFEEYKQQDVLQLKTELESMARRLDARLGSSRGSAASGRIPQIHEGSSQDVQQQQQQKQLRAHVHMPQQQHAKPPLSQPLMVPLLPHQQARREMLYGPFLRNLPPRPPPPLQRAQQQQQQFQHHHQPHMHSLQPEYQRSHQTQQHPSAPPAYTSDTSPSAMPSQPVGNNSLQHGSVTPTYFAGSTAMHGNPPR